MKKIFHKFLYYIGYKPKDIPYSFVPKPFQNKIERDVLLFIAVSLGLIYFGRTDSTIIILGIIILVVGLTFSYRSYYLATRNKIVEVEGVIIDQDFVGLALKRRSYLIQDAEENVYSVTASEIFKFHTANIVKVYFAEERMKFFEDGVYKIGYPILMIRRNAKVTR